MDAVVLLCVTDGQLLVLTMAENARSALGLVNACSDVGCVQSDGFPFIWLKVECLAKCKIEMYPGWRSDNKRWECWIKLQYK